MGKGLTFFYDPVGDILIVERVRAYAEQTTRAIGDGILVRERPDDGTIESVEVWNFTQRSRAEDGLHIPVLAEFGLEPMVRKRAIA